MKSTLILALLLLALGMTISAQSPDMSYYIADYNRTDATVYDLLDIVQSVRDRNLSGIGYFYEHALRMLLYRLPNFNSPLERMAVQDTARIILRGLAAEKQTTAGPYVWSLIQEFDIVQERNDGLLMTEGIITLGEIGAVDYLPHIILRLDNFNADFTTDSHARRKIQMGATGAIAALEALGRPEGVRPVFFASIGWFDPEIRAIAAAAFPHIMEDPSEIVSEIIRSPFNDPSVKFAAWEKLLQSNAPDSSKANVAAIALEISYTYVTPYSEFQKYLTELRMSAIDAIRDYGVEDGSPVYAYLERTYREAYNTPTPDFGTIMRVISTLSAIRTDEAVEILTAFLREINTRRRSGPWGYLERDILRFIIPSIALTGTELPETMQLLTAIERSTAYTQAEQIWATTALRALVK